jgi:hypothetical protein
MLIEDWERIWFFDHIQLSQVLLIIKYYINEKLN